MIVFHNGILQSYLGPGHSNLCCSIILNDIRSNSTKNLPCHTQHHEIFWMVTWILTKPRIIVKTIHTGAVILVVELIKKFQDQIMKNINTLVNVFFQHWIILKVKWLFNLILTKIIKVKPIPLWFVYYTELVSVIILETNVLFVNWKYINQLTRPKRHFYNPLEIIVSRCNFCPHYFV